MNLSNGIVVESAGLVFWLSALVQVGCLATLVAARVRERRQAQGLFQHLFLGALIGVGLTTALAAALANPAWLTGGCILALMVIGATWDLKPRRHEW